jgi:hypothetical protein
LIFCLFVYAVAVFLPSSAPDSMSKRPLLIHDDDDDEGEGRPQKRLHLEIEHKLQALPPDMIVAIRKFSSIRAVMRYAQISKQSEENVAEAMELLYMSDVLQVLKAPTEESDPEDQTMYAFAHETLRRDGSWPDFKFAVATKYKAVVEFVAHRLATRGAALAIATWAPHSGAVVLNCLRHEPGLKQTLSLYFRNGNCIPSSWTSASSEIHEQAMAAANRFTRESLVADEAVLRAGLYKLFCSLFFGISTRLAFEFTHFPKNDNVAVTKSPRWSTSFAELGSFRTT